VLASNRSKSISSLRRILLAAVSSKSSNLMVIITQSYVVLIPIELTVVHITLASEVQIQIQGPKQPPSRP